ncbi:MAG: serine/threonine-protein kinase [Gemmatimonadota bacterium]
MERELGRGGMGVVYLARDVRLDRPVALKVLHSDRAGTADGRARFLHEARTAGRLAHPHIVSIYAVEELHDTVILVMEYVEGETLGQRLQRRGALPPDEAERLVRETAWALGYAHAHNVIHRDLTPANILLERRSGRAVLADFGIATPRDAIERAPRFGTPGYLAPEVIRGESATPGSDLYALGAVGYLALSGRAPLVAESPAQLLARHLVQSPPPLAPFARGASRRLVEAIEMCLAKDPDARPVDVAALLVRLERAPEAVTIAPALRSWFLRWDRIRAIYALATPLLAMQTWLLIQGYFESGQTVLLTAALVTTALSLTAVPLGTHLLFEGAEQRRLRRAGFGLADIRAALPHWRAEMVRERRREGLAPLGGRVIWDLTAIGALTLFVTMVIVWPNLERWHVADAGIVRSAIVWMLSGVYFGTLTGVGIGFLLPGHRPRPDGWINALKERLWCSRPVAWLTALAVAGERAVQAPSSTLHRNTELVLGLAVDDLWKVMPPIAQATLGDVPALAHALQRSAEELRRIADGLRESEATLPEAAVERQEILAVLEPIESRHREAVTALETIRLQLLRVLATRETTSELTLQLEAARGLEAALAREVRGHREVRHFLRHLPRHDSVLATPTPA